MAATPSPARAQTPRTGPATVGADVGVFVPRADFLKSRIEVDGFYQYYLSPRTSARLGGGWMNPKLEVKYHVVSNAEGFNPDGLSSPLVSRNTSDPA